VPTVRNWVRGYRYPTGEGVRRARPIVMLPRDGDGMALSFINLMEVVSLAGFREQGVSMQKLRKALDYVARHMQSTTRSPANAYSPMASSSSGSTKSACETRSTS